MTRILVYDTTLRDGAQGPGVSFSLEDKLALAAKLDELGFDYLEGGYAVANPKEMEFFREVRKLKLKNTTVVSFGNTRRTGARAEDDPSLRSMLDAGTPAACVVGKAWDLHVEVVFKASLDENLAMIADSVRYLKAQGREVIFDAEHYYDGYRANPDYALRCVEAARDAGADFICLCDTNGGTISPDVGEITAATRERIDTPLGIHCHNDGDMATGSTVAAVQAGATMVQGTVNGLGERCGNADLCVVIPTLALKLDREVLPDDSLSRLTELSRYVYELANMIPRDSQPYVGVNAFSHKGGLHVNAVQKMHRTYEHVEPERVGNARHILISELSGRSNVLAKVEAEELRGNPELVKKVLDRLQELENEGYQFEAAEASFDLLVKKLLGKHRTFFDLDRFNVVVDRFHGGRPVTYATVKLSVGGEVRHTASEGDGPVNALDGALRKAIQDFYPSINDVHLIDYKVRVVNPRAGTAAKVRVIIESRDHHNIWSTVGVSENIIEASWQALVDSVEYKLLREEGEKADGPRLEG
ncbi:MAG TPA: citramalate synthase [Planctomycetota bacterium]|nr:citramalate synthase [Planctomycetota bacterium]